MQTSIMKTLTLILALLSVSALNLPECAAVTHWQKTPASGTGDWDNPDNWDYGVPSYGNDAYIQNGGYAELSTYSSIYELRIGDANGSGLNISGTLELGNVILAELTETGGSINVYDSGYLFAHGDIYVGYNGYGFLNIYGGTVSAGNVSLGYSAGYGRMYFGDSGGTFIGNIYGSGPGKLEFSHNGTATIDGIVWGHSTSLEQNSGVSILSNVFVKDVLMNGGELLLTAGSSFTAQEDIVIAGAGHLGTTTPGGVSVQANNIIITDAPVYSVTLDSSLTLNGNTIDISSIKLYINNTSNNGLVVSGDSLQIGSILVDMSYLAPVIDIGQSFVVFDWSGVYSEVDINASQFAVTGLGEGISGTFEVQGSQMILTTTAVPEPSTWFLLGVGLGVLALTRIHRRRNA
ncbi:MAG: PEP-CTERM sorting domain-containing protein [Verrucomicrobiales bacterium]|jgi:hypothetical protein|nr:PEP-CTERM sorting domain-containing protein [Verrucomicrobiales bacterium]